MYVMYVCMFGIIDAQQIDTKYGQKEIITLELLPMRIENPHFLSNGNVSIQLFKIHVPFEEYYTQ